MEEASHRIPVEKAYHPKLPLIGIFVRNSMEPTQALKGAVACNQQLINLINISPYRSDPSQLPFTLFISISATLLPKPHREASCPPNFLKLELPDSHKSFSETN